MTALAAAPHAAPIQIGTFHSFDDDLNVPSAASPAAFAFEELMEGRLLIQAGSGGGKSYCIRKFCEAAFGRVPIILIDREGEFASLRETFDFVLAGREGDTPATVETAAELARTVLETSANIICNLSDLTPEQQTAWVAAFVGEMMNASEELWKDFIVIIDEAHLFCPQKGKVASKGAVTALATLGRKRGFCAVLATQRISKLDKDVAAELHNVLIGKTVLDRDRERARDALDVGTANKAEFNKTVRHFEAGYFYAYGTAISEIEPRIVRIGTCVTTHRKRGQRVRVAAPPPTQAILHLLPAFDRVGKKGPAMFKPDRVIVPAHSPHEVAIDLSSVRSLERRVAEIEGERDRLEREVVALKKNQMPPGLDKKLSELVSALGSLFDLSTNLHRSVTGYDSSERALVVIGEAQSHCLSSKVKNLPPRPVKRVDDERIPAALRGFDLCDREILTALNSHYPHGLTRVQLAVITVYDVRGGGFKNALSRLTKRGYVKHFGDNVYDLTKEGKGLFVDLMTPRRSAQEIVDLWCERKLTGKQRDILRHVFANGTETFTQLQIAATVRMTAKTGGVKNYLGELTSKGLFEQPRRGHYKIAGLFLALLTALIFSFSAVKAYEAHVSSTEVTAPRAKAKDRAPATSPRAGHGPRRAKGARPGPTRPSPRSLAMVTSWSET